MDHFLDLEQKPLINSDRFHDCAQPTPFIGSPIAVKIDMAKKSSTTSAK